MKRISLTASEEMSFENVDRRRTTDRRTDGRQIPLYTISSPMSLGSGELMNQTGQFFRNTSDKTQKKPKLFYLLNAGLAIRSVFQREITMAPRFETESRTINNIKWNGKRRNLSCFSKALHFNEFSACFI